MNIKLCVVLLLGVLFFTSCGRDSSIENVVQQIETVGVSTGTVEYLNAKAYDKWIYYSFSQGEVVEVKDYSNDLSWDIAFHRSEVRLNGGKSGKGKGEVVKMETTEFESVKNAPETGYIKDEIGDVTVSFLAQSGQPKFNTEKQPFSQTMNWAPYTPTQTGPKYVLSKNVFVIKTAKGKYVKIQFLDNYGKAGKDSQHPEGGSGFVTFKYVYNTTGGTDF